jgi:hypothetical protein
MNGTMHRVLNEAEPPPLDVKTVPKIKLKR